MNKQKLLIISSVWPEPKSSAAGMRMMQLIRFFKSFNCEIYYASTASESEFSFSLDQLNVETKQIEVNSESFDEFITEIQPQIVLFDRFMMEEQFGWRVLEKYPSAIRILDTEDLHFLRNLRIQAYKKNIEPQFNSEIAFREIASIYRSDLSLIISEFEMNLLNKTYSIDSSILHYIPFMLPPIAKTDIEKWNPYDQRKNLIFIGNFYHEPNWLTVKYLKDKIWPILSKKLPEVELHIYGAYPSQKVYNLENTKERFIIKGRAEDSLHTISNYRLLIAPIQVGAGLKGKFIDAMQMGTPSITTSIGAEGINGEFHWSGAICQQDNDFIQSTVDLYTNQNLWDEAQQKGAIILNQRFNKEVFEIQFQDRLNDLFKNINNHRSQNFIGNMLNHHHLQSTKYLSKWIQEKNK